MAEIKVTYIDLNSLKTYQNNPKDHPQKLVLQMLIRHVRFLEYVTATSLVNTTEKSYYWKFAE
ncbi:MAG TPA: hypothetical protein IAC63_00045 [Candidatus Enterousia avicola]|uniref:Uncharacterized protein n=1 Tax=Candidatus Enterousia avicola TaxID=2840787 RepID=A0A9D1MQY7_9PROT|nr:hypothetical protein [Candidatus Enterousia avicola]